MKTLLYFASMVAAGLIAGIAAFNHFSDAAISASGIKNGPWVTNTAYGDKDADPFLRTGVARSGLLALKRSETIYYTAYTDSSGAALSDKCTYKVTGQAPETRWWSFTLYGEDNFLIDTGFDVYSVFMDPVSRDVDFVISPERPTDETDWLPSSGGGAVSVTLRLYNPSQSVYDSMETTPLPAITRESCT